MLCLMKFPLIFMLCFSLFPQGKLKVGLAPKKTDFMQSFSSMMVYNFNHKNSGLYGSYFSTASCNYFFCCW